MPKAIETILKSVGLPDEDITKITSLPEAEQETFDIKPLIEKVKGNYQTQFQNDPEFFKGITIENLPPSVKKSIESGQYARATNEAKGKIAKALGFSAEEIKDLEGDDFKALDFYIPAITDKWTKSKAGAPKMQEELIAERKKREELEKKYTPEYENEIHKKAEEKAEQKVTDAVLDYNVVAQLSSIPNFKINAVDVSKTAIDILNSRYAHARVGNLIELRQKDAPAMKVLKNGSSEELTLGEALTTIAVERGWVDKEKEPTSGSGTVTAVVPVNGQLKFAAAPHVAPNIAKKIESEKSS